LCDEAAAFADLLARHLAHGFSVAANRAKQNDKILHATRERPPPAISQSVPGK